MKTADMCQRNGERIMEANSLISHYAVHTVIALAVTILSLGCTSSGSHVGGYAACARSNKKTSVGFDTRTPLGFSADDYLKTAERNAEAVEFEWLPYDPNGLSSASPPDGARSTAVVSISRDSAKPTFYESTNGECLSFLEFTVQYSLSTSDGYLAESVPLTLRSERANLASGESELAPSMLKGSLRPSSGQGVNPIVVLGLRLGTTVTYGGVMYRDEHQGGGTVKNQLLGRWPAQTEDPGI